MNFEAVNQHVESLPPVPTVPTGTTTAADICAAYKAVKPILLLVSGFPFFPAKWKTYLTAFLGILDGFCP